MDWRGLTLRQKIGQTVIKLSKIETEHFKERHKTRWKIEQRNSHLKNQYGLSKTYGTGLWSMKAQSYLMAFTANIVKITKLVATI